MAIQIMANAMLVPQKIKNLIKNSLKEDGFNAEMTEGSLASSQSIELLLSRSIDVLLFPLDRIPFEHPLDIKIWSLLPREKVNNVILVNKKYADGQERIPIPLESEILIDSHFISNVLSEIRLDLKFKVVKKNDLLNDVHDGVAKFVVLPELYIDDNIRQRYDIVKLNEREFCHTAGQGAIALIARKDSPYGNLLRKFYDQKTVTECNIERLVAKELKGKTNIHVEQDHNGHFHLWLINTHEGKSKKNHFSQSTRNGIVEKAIYELNN